MILITNLLNLIAYIVPATRHPKIAGLYVPKTILVSTLQIKENYFSTLTGYACRQSPHNFGTAPNDVHAFRSLHYFLAEILPNDVEAVKTCLNHSFA